MDWDGHHAANEHLPESAGEFSQLALWMAANVAGVVTGVLLARGPFFRELARRVGHGRPRRHAPPQRKSLALLAQAVIGSTRQTIESVFGPPRSISLDEIGVVVHPRQVYRLSDTWYYPLPRSLPLAMAINFQDEIATTVEFFSPPQPHS